MAPVKTFEPLAPATVVSRLNAMLKTEPAVIRTLFSYTVACGTAMACHPSVQVGAVIHEPGIINTNQGKKQTKGSTDYYVRVLGLINGLYGADEDGWGPIVAVYNKSKLVRFELVTEAHKASGKDRNWQKQDIDG